MKTLIKKLLAEKHVLHEAMQVTKEGERFPVELHSRLFELEGVPTVISIARDITERKQAEEALRKSETRFRLLIEKNADGIIMVDRDGIVLFANPAAEALLDRKREELIGQMFGIPSVERESTETKIMRKDGGIATAEMRLVKVDWNGGIAYIATLRDITQKKHAEEALRKAKRDVESANRQLMEVNEQLEHEVARANEMALLAEMADTAKSQFLANMSHEIRTPMNAVIGFTDILLDSNLEEDQMDFARTIKRSGEALLYLINDILDFSKIEAGELDFEEIDFDPELLAHDVCELIRLRIKSKPIEILCRIGDGIPSLVKGDPARFRQVLTNLMGNAAKFTESGELELFLDNEEEKDGRLKLHLMIRDTGIGIPKEKLAHIFTPFQQADSSTTRRYGGTGLGLSICEQLSKLMNGEIWAESEVGKGSTFHFTAWVGKADDHVAKRYTPVLLSGKRVLIVDNNRSSLDILRHALESIGMGVELLNNGEQVVPSLKKALEEGNPFDLCITDIQVPGMNGYEIAKQIRDLNNPLSNLPLIALSSLMKRNARRCEEAGFNGFLSKPIRRERLFQMLEGILGKRADEREKDKGVREKIVTQYSVREELKHSARILLAEDNPVNQKLAKMILIKAGYQVEVANNGLEAVEKYTTSPDDFDLIIMDVQMPEMDGMEATMAIREKGFNTIPIVAMTAHSMKKDMEKCFEAGMDDYITKPIKRELVLEILEKRIFGRETSRIIVEKIPDF
jgi:signal transduction histidine kinase/DNA-binding response OmpR family regulator